MASETIKPIILTDNASGEVYTLEYSRESVVFINNHGFKRSEIEDNMEEMLPLLFWGAFRMHHRRISRTQADAILEKLGGITDSMLNRLIALYNVPITTLVRSDDEGTDSENFTVTM